MKVTASSAEWPWRYANSFSGNKAGKVVNMFFQLGSNNLFKNFAIYWQKGDRSIIPCKVLISRFEYRCDDGFLEQPRHDTTEQRGVKYLRRWRRQNRCTSLQEMAGMSWFSGLKMADSLFSSYIFVSLTGLSRFNLHVFATPVSFSSQGKKIVTTIILLSIDSNFGHGPVVRSNFLQTKAITCTYICIGVFYGPGKSAFIVRFKRQYACVQAHPCIIPPNHRSEHAQAQGLLTEFCGVEKTLQLSLRLSNLFFNLMLFFFFSFISNLRKTNTEVIRRNHPPGIVAEYATIIKPETIYTNNLSQSCCRRLQFAEN